MDMDVDAGSPPLGDIDESHELIVTFNPPLFLERRGWVLDIVREEGVTQILDVGCGEGELIACLCNPAPWLKDPPPPDLHLPSSPAIANVHRTQFMEYRIPAQPNSLPSNEKFFDNYIRVAQLHGLDVSSSDLVHAVDAVSTRESGSASPWMKRPRWEPMNAKIWKGGLEVFNPEFVGIECIVATEVVEHLDEDILQDFAPVLLGLYHPKLLLITTPSYTYNARFTAPNAPTGTREGFPDPTGRTDRIFRHDDHKFEWTVEEFAAWCNEVAEQWGYEVQVGGVGRADEKDPWGRDAELGFASQTAAFRRKEGAEYAEKRARQCESLGLMQKMASRTQHVLLADNDHTQHPTARNPAPLADVAAAIKKKMDEVRDGMLTTREIWFHDEICTACGGWVEVLIAAAQQDGLNLRLATSEDGHTWEVVYPAFVPRPPSPEPEAESSDDGRMDEDADEEDAWTNADSVHATVAEDAETTWGDDFGGWGASSEKVEWGASADEGGDHGWEDDNILAWQ
ncbi:hypothetical protein EIP91_002323 [Steccherinum ochraceum]|uniref:Small RNA 2'-O-methyltransferase n=1 Tax=Steccherinum ochraceum TaxID=92696 RepID=A0A4R0REV0_9APHY|nr:hypothetical protein EIP91_002323 [Steccherinum ochraceum]